ncbi:MAG: arginine decarboxylase, pyruvoyl-dependent [Candidatus Lokiarchaeota archaeon]|jgi:arginine decarboxylase|nr:arginine decarboxylase, pyruvoyl-dependent [Candidatus Lokiarchaeota archaeon]
MSLVPKKVFFVSGKGFHKIKLAAFEQALRDAGIEKYNLVSVSSILPPFCIEILKEDGLKQLHPGQIVHCVLAREESNEYNRLIASSIGVAKPADKGQYGYLSEYHAYGKKPETVADTAEDLAAEMLASTLGIPFDPDQNYDEKKEVYKMGGKIVETKSITIHTIVKEENEWACTIAAAIFIV